MRVIIESLHRAGNRREWIMTLSCGHRGIVTNEQVRGDQLFIGKRVRCAECKKQVNGQ